MSAWRIHLIVECDADNEREAHEIASMVWERCSPLVRDIDGVRWLLPNAEIELRKPFLTPPPERKAAGS